jgi:hypothetical protein
MFTVKELIEALQQCPEDYIVWVSTNHITSELEAVGIDNEEKAVDLFGD